MSNLRTLLDSVRSFDPRPRGRAFEKFLAEVFAQESIRHRLSYRPEGEEIDGAFWWSQRTFLLEAKWHADPMPASSIYAFKGKVDGKFAETLGVFVSISGYSKDCVEAVTHGKNLNILLFDGEDVDAIADGEPFVRILEEKLFSAGQTGNIYMPWSTLKQTQTVIQTVNKATEAPPAGTSPSAIPLVVICEGPADKVALDSLIKYVADDQGAFIEPKFIVSHGKAPLLDSIAPSLISLLSKGVSGPAAVLLVFDADTTDPVSIEQQRVRAKRMFDDLPAEWKGFVAIAIPEIENWLGLTGRVDRAVLLAHLATIDWNRLSQQHPEIQALVTFLRSLK